MIVRGESTIIDYNAPFDQGLKQSKIGENGYNTEIEIIDCVLKPLPKKKKYK